MNHKPMLAVDCGPLESLRFPLLASTKLDGVRAVISADCVLSRSLKPIPNRKVQELLKGLPVGLDGELIAGDPTAPDAYRKTVSMVMSEDADITGLKYHVFDIQKDGVDYVHRQYAAERATEGFPGLEWVKQLVIWDLQQLEVFESWCIEKGYEGVILRAPDSPYKHGRSTRKEGYLLKLKRFQDGEAEVTGVTELMHNGNEAKINELGRTARSSHKAGKIPSGMLGTLVVKDTKTGVTFEIGTGFTQEERVKLWANGQGWTLAGRLAKYKHFPVGAKDKPRHPVFLGWRDKRDV